MIRLILNRIAIVPLENPDMIGHIIVPDIAKTRLNQGFIKYTGPDVKECVVGDYVLFSEYTGSTTYIENEGKLIVMPEDFIIAHITNLPNLEIPGLFFKDKDGEAFPATFEMSMNYIAMHFAENSKWRDRFNVRSMAKPTLKDYDKSRGGPSVN